MSGDIPPFIFALIAAVLFAFGTQIQNIGLSQVDSRTGTAISIAASAALYWMLAPFLLNGDNWLHSSVFIFILVGLFRPSVSANLAVAGMRHLGPTLSMTLSSTSPLFGVAFGVLWLNETLTWPVIAGTFGIIFAVLILSKRSSKTVESWPVWALGLPIGAAAVRSLSHVLSKIGMVGIPDPYFVGLVCFSVSALVTMATNRVGNASRPISWRQHGPYWFLLSGFFMGTAILALNTALLSGDIITVIPIVASAPIFTMLFSILIFRREHLTMRVVTAVLIVVPSVILIALNQ